MKRIKLPHVLFSLAMVAVLTLSAIPMAPAYALSDSPTSTSVAATNTDAPVLTASAVVCRNVIRWHNGHRVVVRVCHRVHKPASQ